MVAISPVIFQFFNSFAMYPNRFAPLTIGMMEQWNNGIMGPIYITLKRNMIYEINASWIEKTSIEVLKNSGSGKMPDQISVALWAL